MPKLVEQKKAKTQPKQEVKVTPQKPAEQKVVVFRVFECVVHLEEALAQLKKVGIFPGPAENAERVMTLLKERIRMIEAIHQEYLTAWGAMQK